MKRALVFTALCFIAILANASNYRQLSDDSYIEIYTCAPGNQLYSQFGHTAIGVIDPKQKIDEVFNYGTFSFNTPHFYLKFCAGKLLYQLTSESFDRFVISYEYRGRQVLAQKLNLSLEQRQHLFDLLNENNKPENCDYQYDFFFDNCATRVLDMLYKAFGESLIYVDSDSLQQPSLRDCIHPYLSGSRWSKAGIDLVLGSITDRVATKREQSFIPDRLYEYLSECKIDTLPLVGAERIVVDSTIEYAVTPILLSPFIVFLLIFIVMLVLTAKSKKMNWVAIDRIYFCLIGILGLVTALLWFATDHGATVGNYNLLWASPLYLIYVFVVGAEPKMWHKWLWIVLVVGNIAMLFGFLLPQYFNLCFYPLVATSLLRLLCGRPKSNLSR